jgi:hypothetical protein
MVNEREEAERKRAEWPVRVNIDIPLNMMLQERVDRFEIPLELALAEDGIIESAGMVSQKTNGRFQVHMVGITVRVKSIESSLSIIQKTLKQGQAPSDTRIIVENTRLEIYDLGG